MDLPYISDTIPLDKMGNVDVSKEMENIKILKDAGYDITDMEELLFADIEQYKIRRASIIEVYNTMDAVDVGPGMELDLTTEEPEEDDLLLYGGPMIDNDDLQVNEEEITLESPEEDIDQVDEDLFDLSSPTIQDEAAGEEVIREEQETDLVENDETVSQGYLPEDTGRIKGPRSGQRSLLIGLGIILVITILAAGSYLFLFSSNETNAPEEEFSAEFTLSDIDPVIGNVLNCSASVIDPDFQYQWEIIPEHYELMSTDMMKPYLELYFKQPGNFRIDLKVISKTEELTEHEFIEVNNREITIERERYGDTSRYDLNGHLNVQNVDDMIEDKTLYQYETLDIDFWTEEANPMVVSISDSISQGKDGLEMEYHKMERNTDQFLRFSGTISRFAGETLAITGHSSISQQNHIDLFNQRSFRTFSDTSTHISIPVPSSLSIEYDMEESMILYPSLYGESNDLRIEDIIEGRNLSVNDEGIARWGPYDLTWEATELELVMDRPSIKVEFQMDQGSKKDLKLEEFLMIHWIAGDISSPVRTILNATTRDDIEHPSEIYIFQEMISFSPGEDFVLYGSADHRHQKITSAEILMNELENEFSDDWEFIPPLGSLSSSIPSIIGPEIALQAIFDTPSYQGWSINKDDLLVSYSNFSYIRGTDQWEIIISEPDNEWGWNDTVKDGEAKGGKLLKIIPKSKERGDIPAVLTFSGAEHSLRELLPDLDSSSTTKIFGKARPASSDKIRLEENSLTARIDHPYPRIGLVDPSLGGSIPYCFVIESFDGSIEVGLDMTNGQISYILERKQL